MISWRMLAPLALGLIVASTAPAWSASPSDSTTAAVSALCKDGTSWSGASKRGACKGHQGVKQWTTASTTAAPAPAGTKPTTAKPGGGAGQVWVNTESKVFHCQGSRYYGKTKKGEYMSQQNALAHGYHLAKNEKCS